MISVALVCAFIAWRRGLHRQRHWWIPLALIPIAVLFLQLPFSLPIWNILPKMRFLQFPWRWLVVLEAPLGIFFAAAIWPTRRWLRVAVVAGSSAIFVSTTVVTTLLFHQPCDAEDKVSGMLGVFRSGQGFQGTDEYAPPGADNSLMATGLPDACLTTNPSLVLASSDDGNTPAWNPATGHCDATYSWLRGKSQFSPEHIRLAADMPHAGYLILRLRNYAAWRVDINGKTVALDERPIYGPLPHRDDGLMAVPVPQGSVRLNVDWTTTADVVMGRLISLMSLGYFTVLFLIERKLTSHAETKPGLGYHK